MGMTSWIDAYLTDPSVSRETDAHGNTVGVRVLGNGCNLFFQMNDRYLICEIDMIAFGLISRTITAWNTGESIRGDERRRLLPAIVTMFETYYGRGRKADVR